MNQVGVIGDLDSVIAFRALGMTVEEARNPQEALEHLRHMVRAKYAVIYITEDLAQANLEYLQEIRAQRLPAVIPIPSITGTTGLGMRQVRESVRKAVGIDILGSDRENESAAKGD